MEYSSTSPDEEKTFSFIMWQPFSLYRLDDLNIVKISDAYSKNNHVFTFYKDLHSGKFLITCLDKATQKTTFTELPYKSIRDMKMIELFQKFVASQK